METFKIRSLSVLSSVFLSYLFSNNFLMCFPWITANPKASSTAGSAAGGSGPGFDQHQTYKSEIIVIVFNSNVSLAF